MKDRPSTGSRGRTAEPWSRFTFWATILALGAIGLAYFLPSLGAGIQGQDIALDSINGYAIYHDLGRFSAITHALSEIEFQQGGWLPLKGLILALWSLGPPAPLIRGLQAFTVTCDLLMFAILVARQWQSLSLGAVASLGALLALQFHKPHDAVLDSSLIIPVSFAFILASYLWFTSYIVDRRWCTLVAAALSLLLASTLHESAWILAIGIPMFAFSAGSARRAALAVLLIPGACFGMTAIWQLPAPSSLRWLGDPTLADLKRGTVQLFGAVPMTYRAFDNVERHNAVVGEIDTRFWDVPDISATGQLLVLAASLLMFAVSTGLRPTTSRGSLHKRSPAIAGILFAISSFVLIDPNVWPTGIPIGEATDATFFGCFAFGILFAYAVIAITATFQGSRARAAIAPLLALFVGLILYGNVRVNSRIIDIDQKRFEQIRLLNVGAKAGLFYSLPPLATLALDSDFGLSLTNGTGLANPDYFLSGLVGHKQHVVPISRLNSIERDCPRRSSTICASSRVWLLKKIDQGPGQGGLLLAHWTGSTDPATLVDHVIAFQDESTFEPSNWNVSDIQGNGIRTVSRTVSNGHIITTIDRSCGAVPIAAALQPDEPKIILASGFLPGNLFKYYQFAVSSILQTRPDGDQDWHYAEATSQLRVYPDGCGKLSDEYLKADVFAPSPTVLKITSQGHTTRMNISESATRIDIPLRLGENPHTAVSVTLHTDGPPALEELMYPPFSRAKYPPAHLLVNHLTISDTHD